MKTMTIAAYNEKRKIWKIYDKLAKEDKYFLHWATARYLLWFQLQVSILKVTRAKTYSLFHDEYVMLVDMNFATQTLRTKGH